MASFTSPRGASPPPPPRQPADISLRRGGESGATWGRRINRDDNERLTSKPLVGTCQAPLGC